ncbi:hypothetical protein [Dyadobacter sp. CY343]|uniref:hypothetical protein n=1 Tax=Dyadobacter sp. CY343 TaxID=2907299 RepID=UPI001F30CF9C|nr:hypothetical protein [Dyadobacter sp. CY343]MCE7059829.1 hypothetical protein [Dyadobacter sp. CY343]
MSRKIAMVKSQSEMTKVGQASDDLAYWLSRPVQERLAAVTFLVNQNLAPSQRMDKNAVFRKMMK